MASLKDEVLAKLAAVPTPDGAPLTQSGKLSDILVTDGKVFCSITVDARRSRRGRACGRVPKARCARYPACAR